MSSIEGGPFTVRFRQSKLLLKKNFILQKRNVRNTVVQLLVPFLFILLLYVLQFGILDNDRLSDDVHIVRQSTPLDILPFPRCLPQQPKMPCISIAYVPANDSSSSFVDIDSVIQTIASKNGIPSSEIMRFNSTYHMDVYLLNNPNTTQIAVSFNWTTTNTSFGVIPQLAYVLQFNQTETYTESLVVVDIYQYMVIPFQTNLERELASAIYGSNVNYDVQIDPYAHPELVNTDVIGSNGPAFFYAALMFNVVIQLGMIVNESELHLREGMNVMGLKDCVFWFTWWVTNSILNTLSIIILIISGYIFQFDFFLHNNFGLFFFLFFLFGLAMVPVVFFLSTLVTRANTATTLGFVIFLIGIIIQAFASLAFVQDFYTWLRVILSLLPFALLAKGISDLSDAITNDGAGLRWTDRSTNAWFSLTDCYKWLVIDFFVFLGLALYIDLAFRRGNGILFFFKPSYWGYKTKRRLDSMNRKVDGAEYNGIDTLQTNPNQPNFDSDVLQERVNVLSGNLPVSNAIRIINLVKKFGDFRAVNDVCLGIDSGQLFCLLGHNGAGKTTTINMLTGMFPPSSGDAILFGDSIISDMNEIRKNMGVCPQHDVLWDQLSGKEHLELFAGFKGIPEDQVQGEVESRLADVDLLKRANLMSSQYSGGMKRRLSTAIALTADPKLVFLDEPTTGMDPISRRQVWNLIEKVKRGRLIILTTHSMEEADVLGDRIGIMSRGQLIALGTSLHLKNKFGAGYRVVVILKDQAPQTVEGVRTFFLNGLGIECAGSVLGIMDYNIPRPLLPSLPQFFAHLEGNKENLGIRDLQLSMTTLEEVFLTLAGHSEEH